MNKETENESITPEEFLQKYDDGENPELNPDNDSTSDSVHRCARILALSDRLLEKISLAIDEVDLYKIKVKEKTKDVEYDDETKKIVNETQTEREKAETGKSLIDTSALKQLVSTLKDIKDIHVSLESSNDTDSDTENGVIVISEATDGRE